MISPPRCARFQRLVHFCPHITFDVISSCAIVATAVLAYREAIVDVFIVYTLMPQLARSHYRRFIMFSRAVTTRRRRYSGTMP